MIQNGSIGITLIPETIEEFASLLRFSLNANSEKPNGLLSFYDNPYCDIWLKKRKSSVQKNSINPNTK